MSVLAGGVAGCPHVRFALLGFLVCASTAAAQGSDRPFRGLFNRDAAALARAPLTFRVALAETYDDNVLAETSVGPTANRDDSLKGLYTALAMDLTYHRYGSGPTVVAEVGSVLRYYPDLLDSVSGTHQAALRLGTGAQSRVRLSVAQTARYAPYHVMSLVPAISPDAIAPAGAAFDLAVSSRERLQSDTSGRVAIDLTRTTEASVTGGLQWQQLDLGGVRRYDMGAHLSRAVTRNLRLVAGYEQQRQSGRAAQAARVHNIDIGAQYDRALTRANRTRVSFSSGTAMLERTRRLEYRLVGGARLTHDFARTWTLGGAFGREFVYFDWLAEPLFADRASLDLAGRLTRRLELRLSGGYAEGSQPSGSVSAFDMASATATLRCLITPGLGVFTEYSRFEYSFEGPAVVSGLRPSLGRQAVRAGFAWLLPLVRRDRRPR